MFGHVPDLLVLSTGSISPPGLSHYAFQAPGQENQAPWWLFILLVVIGVISAAVWWLAGRNQEPVPEPTQALETTSAATKAEAVPPLAESVPAPALVAERQEAAAVKVEPTAPSLETPAPAVAAPPAQPDNLTRIEGIGPKISGILQAAGIHTFAQLAQTEVSRLKQILAESNLKHRLAKPDTWPQQAGLAARGEWEALEELQDELQGGRRVN